MPARLIRGHRTCSSPHMPGPVAPHCSEHAMPEKVNGSRLAPKPNIGTKADPIQTHKHEEKSLRRVDIALHMYRPEEHTIMKDLRSAMQNLNPSINQHCSSDNDESDLDHEFRRIIETTEALNKQTPPAHHDIDPIWCDNVPRQSASVPSRPPATTAPAECNDEDDAPVILSGPGPCIAAKNQGLWWRNAAILEARSDKNTRLVHDQWIEEFEMESD